jgi:formamidopyrimidine-DNA glycosylase
MPELPEVETTVRDLKKTILGQKIIDFWTDFKKNIKQPKNLEEFKKIIIGRKIENVKRRGKNILIVLSGKKILLIHQKLTGHLLCGKWKVNHGIWFPFGIGPLNDPVNRFIHLIFKLDNGEMLALSDLRKFAKVEIWDRTKLEDSKEFKDLGPEPLDKNFTFEKFKERLQKKKKGRIKQVLMDQNIIAGIGNIYSDEILWKAKVHPFRDISKLKNNKLKEIYRAMKEILPKAIKLGGESFSDFRRISGKRGYFDKERKVYQRTGEKCGRCGEVIRRLKMDGRSAHFCPVCQK